MQQRTETRKMLNEYLSIFPAEMLTECPCHHCKTPVAALKPGADQVFDSLVSCPDCAQLFYRTINADGSVETSTLEQRLYSHDNEDEYPTAFKDSFYEQAVEFVYQTRRASIVSLQRHLRIGYNRSARIIEAMEAAGFVVPASVNGLREVAYPKCHVIDFLTSKDLKTRTTQ